MGRVRREWIALAALVVAACGDDAAVAPTAPQTSVTSDGSGEEVHLDFNARMALAARRAPGFAGIYVEDGTWRIAMKGSRALDAATRAEVRDLLISGSTGDDARAVAENRANTAVRAQASYDFAELYDWFQVVVDSVLPLDGVHWADIDERQNRIVIGVRDEGRIDVFRSRVSELPIPPAAIEVRFTPGRFTTSADLKNKARPTVGGVSIQSPTCTLGFNADRYGDSSWYAITAAHCLGSLGHVGSVSYYQPSYPHTIGTEAYTAPMFYNAQNSACPSGHWCTYADAAAIKYSIGQWQQGMVAWPTLTSGTSYSAVMYVMSEGDAYQGTDVSKVGRTTGRTAGEVLQTCVHVDHDEPLDFYLLCAWITDLEVDYGDSGGPVVEVTSGTQVRNVGLVQGFNPENSSESVYTSVVEWKLALSGSWCTTVYCAPDPGIYASGPTLIPKGGGPDVICDWTASAWGGVPPYSITWSGIGSGSGSTFIGTNVSSGWLTASVIDYAGHADSHSIYVTAEEGAALPPECQSYW